MQELKYIIVQQYVKKRIDYLKQMKRKQEGKQRHPYISAGIS